MKQLLTMALMIIAFTASAQQPLVRTYKLPATKPDRKMMDSLLAIYKGKHPEKFILQVKPRPGIHFLADGMACIVPEPPTTGLIRNAWSATISLPYRSDLHAIPNPALPKSKEPAPDVTK